MEGSGVPSYTAMLRAGCKRISCMMGMVRRLESLLELFLQNSHGSGCRSHRWDYTQDAGLQGCLLASRQPSQHVKLLEHWLPEKASSWNVFMIPQLFCPWLPHTMVLGALPWVEKRIWPVHDALSMAEELDVVLLNQFPTAHQPAMDL